MLYPNYELKLVTCNSFVLVVLWGGKEGRGNDARGYSDQGKLSYFRRQVPKREEPSGSD